MRDIGLRLNTVDGLSRSASFKTLAGAQRWAWKRVGRTPDYSPTFGYAVSAYGNAKVTVTRGATIGEIFPEA